MKKLSYQKYFPEIAGLTPGAIFQDPLPDSDDPDRILYLVMIPAEEGMGVLSLMIHKSGIGAITVKTLHSPIDVRRFQLIAPHEYEATFDLFVQAAQNEVDHHRQQLERWTAIRSGLDFFRGLPNKTTGLQQ